ncbi:hypothetical protein ACLOJK_038237 [Asimina triloba]
MDASNGASYEVCDMDARSAARFMIVRSCMRYDGSIISFFVDQPTKGWGSLKKMIS